MIPRISFIYLLIITFLPYFSDSLRFSVYTLIYHNLPSSGIFITSHAVWVPMIKYFLSPTHHYAIVIFLLLHGAADWCCAIFISVFILNSFYFYVFKSLPSFFWNFNLLLISFKRCSIWDLLAFSLEVNLFLFFSFYFFFI